MTAPYLDWLQAQPQGQLIKEQRVGGFVLSVGGQPARWVQEFRAAHRALPPGPKRMSPAELDAYFARMRARIDELEAGATS